MNLLTQLLRIARKLGFDPVELANNLKDQEALRRLDAAAKGTAARMRREHITPAELSDNDAEKRQLIRFALYWQCKALVGSGTLGDMLRDAVDEPIVRALTPVVTAEMQPRGLVNHVSEALVAALPDVPAVL